MTRNRIKAPFLTFCVLLLLASGCESKNDTGDLSSGGPKPVFSISDVTTTRNTEEVAVKFTVTNLSQQDVLVVDLLLTYGVKQAGGDSDLEPRTLWVTAEPKPGGDVNLSPGESHAFKATYPDLADTPRDRVLDRNRLDVSVRAAAIQDQGRQYSIEQSIGVAIEPPDK